MTVSGHGPYRFEVRLAIVLSCLSLAVAGLTLGAVMSDRDQVRAEASQSDVATGPVARAQWQETLRTAFDDLASLPATLPDRSGVAFGLPDEPDNSTVAQPELPAPMPRS